MRAVDDDYSKRSMDELAEHALQIITEQPGLRCGGIGDQLFRDVATLRGSAPFARLAGKVMRKLEREGKAYYCGKGFGGWYPAN